MAQGVLSRLPDLTATAQLSAGAGNGLLSVSGSLAALNTGQSGSPLGAVADAIGGLRGKLNIDVSGLSTQLPGALTTIQNAIPSSSVDFINGIQHGYTDAQSFLQNSEVVKLVGQSPSLQDAALAAISDLLQAFQDRQNELTGKLIDPALLQSVTDTFTAVEQFGSDFANHQEKFLPFLAKNLIGVSHDLLTAAVTHVNTAVSVAGRFDPAAVETAIGNLRTAADNAFVALMDQLETFDPADANAYVQIQAQLQVSATASQALRDALVPFYQGLQGAVDSHAWDTIFSTLETLLRAITIDAPLSANDVIAAISDMLNELLLRVQSLLVPSDLAGRIESVNQSMRDAVAGSVLGQIRSTLQGFLDKIRQAIESVPTEQIQATIEEMLGRVKQEIDQLDLTQIGTTIEAKLQEAEQFVTDHLNDALKNNVKSAVDDLLQNLKKLPIQDIGKQLADAIGQVKSLIDELEAAIQGSMDQLTQFLSQLDGLSFKPVSDEVIGEIDDVKSRLQAINPNALSDIEKVALKAALAVLQAVDLEGKVNVQLKNGFHAAGGALKSLLNDLAAVIDVLNKRLDAFQPQHVVGTLLDLLDKVSKLADQLNGRALLAPFYGQIDELAKNLDALSPGRILDPLEAPYQAVVGVINQLDPAQIVEPLNGLYAQINKLIGFIDVTPLLDELDRRQRSMLTAARTGLLGAFDALHLPEPLAGFLNGLRPVVEAISDALFSTPDEALKTLILDLPKHVKLTSLFEPLDKVFDDLMGMVRSVPADALTTAMETIRQSLAVGLQVIDPANIIRVFRAAQSLASEVSPSLLLGMPLSLPSFKLQFQARVEGASAGNESAIAATLARFDAAIQITGIADDHGAVHDLLAAHQALEVALRRRVNALNASGAEAAYGGLRAGLDRLLPDFLRRSQPLAYADVLAGIETLRPSHAASRLEDLVATFLQKLEPMQTAIQPGIDGFFQNIRDTVNLINPLSIKDSVASVYDLIRQKIKVLDPAQLADQLKKDVFDPVTSAVTQLDPAQWKQRLDQAFQRVVAALTNNVKAILDDIVAAIDVQLRAIREQIQSVVTQIKAVFAAVIQDLQAVLDKVKHLVFVEILERLRKLIDNLEGSFGQELDRVRAAFDQMLAAIPLGGSAASQVAA